LILPFEEIRMRTLLLVAGAILLSGEAWAAQNSALSAKDILAKSEAAYAAVKTYVGTTTVRTKSDIGGVKLEQVSTSKITFARPGKVRIEGRTASHNAAVQGGPPFMIVSDGKTTWRSWAIQSKGAFAEVKNVSMAGMGGVAQGAAECIPAALMKSDGAWSGGHDPFIVPRLSETKLEGREQVDGAECYKLVAMNPKLGDVTLWIDENSFLLRQMTREHDEAQLAALSKSVDESLKKFGKERPDKGVKITSRISVSSFTNDQVDGQVSETAFADPTKSGK
jgi:hypothetical protein